MRLCLSSSCFECVTAVQIIRAFAVVPQSRAKHFAGAENDVRFGGGGNFSRHAG